MNIIFNHDGSAVCLHTDEIPLQSLGTMAVRRASAVEFDDAGQQWTVVGGLGAVMFRNAIRQVCLQWEQDNWELFL